MRSRRGKRSEGTRQQAQSLRIVASVKMEAFILSETGVFTGFGQRSDTRMIDAYALEGTVWLLC